MKTNPRQQIMQRESGTQDIKYKRTFKKQRKLNHRTQKEKLRQHGGAHVF
jgi:hypothetical protein